MISAKSWEHSKVFFNFILEFPFFFTVRIILLYFVASVRPSSLVNSTAHTIYSFFEVMINVISFCLYVMNEMWRNLIKIYIIMLFSGGLTFLKGLANDFLIFDF